MNELDTDQTMLEVTQHHCRFGMRIILTSPPLCWNSNVYQTPQLTERRVHEITRYSWNFPNDVFHLICRAKLRKRYFCSSEGQSGSRYRGRTRYKWIGRCRCPCGCCCSGASLRWIWVGRNHWWSVKRRIILCQTLTHSTEIGTAAASTQAAIGNVATPSLFATLTSAGAGGYGVAAVGTAAKAIGGTVMGLAGATGAWLTTRT